MEGLTEEHAQEGVRDIRRRSCGQWVLSRDSICLARVWDWKEGGESKNAVIHPSFSRSVSQVTLGTDRTAYVRMK